MKRTNFKPGSCPNDLLEIYYFYLTNKVEFGQDILQDCVSSYHRYFCIVKILSRENIVKGQQKISYYLVQGDGMRVHALRLILIIFWRRIKKFFIVLLASFVFVNLIYIYI